MGPTITPRVFPTSILDASVPRAWLAGSPLATHIANGVSLLFPLGERFFVRSVRHYQSLIERDPELADAVRRFATQEGLHARAHERHIELLEEQGYRVRPFLHAYDRLAFGVIEKLFPPNLRLAATAACEHFTAVLAENFLREMDEGRVDPVMRKLLGWHACEEIEHRAVAFDVLARADGRHSVRVAGLAIATVTLSGFWIAATLWLLAQEPHLLKTVTRDGREVAARQPFGERVFGRAIRAYLARDFHPLDNEELDTLAASFLSRAGFTASASAEPVWSRNPLET